MYVHVHVGVDVGDDIGVGVFSWGRAGCQATIVQGALSCYVKISTAGGVQMPV